MSGWLQFAAPLWHNSNLQGTAPSTSCCRTAKCWEFQQKWAHHSQDSRKQRSFPHLLALLTPNTNRHYICSENNDRRVKTTPLVSVSSPIPPSNSSPAIQRPVCPGLWYPESHVTGMATGQKQSTSHEPHQREILQPAWWESWNIDASYSLWLSLGRSGRKWAIQACNSLPECWWVWNVYGVCVWLRLWLCVDMFTWCVQRAWVLWLVGTCRCKVVCSGTILFERIGNIRWIW